MVTKGCPVSVTYLSHYTPGTKYIGRARKLFGTYSSCGASGLNFSLVLTPDELVLKSGILKETKHIIQ